MIKPLIIYLILICLLPMISFCQDHYDIDKKYTISQIQSDFNYLREILETDHPRLYEFTPKREFDFFLDSLYSCINKEMTEREIQYFLAQIIAKVRCAHTKLMPSKQLTEHFNEYFEAPPFKLFFKDQKAYLQSNFSSDTTIKAGAEIVAINDIPIKEITHNFLNRIHQEGWNQTFIYNRMNTGMYGLFPGICDYPIIKSYKLDYIDPKTTLHRQVTLNPMPFSDYELQIYKHKKQDLEFYTIDSLNTGVLSILTFRIRQDTDLYFRNYMANTFEELKSKGIKNLIIDLRGNIGGWPTNGNALLKYIMKEPFTFFNDNAVNWDELKQPTQLDNNRFTGNLYFLVDGAGRSCTGVVLAFIKYYKLGPIIGEETCTSASTNDGHGDHELPNSKLIFGCPKRIYEIPIKDNFVRGHGIMPDYEVDICIDDLLSGKDKSLEIALDMIRK
jgi:hypothetical protein